MSRGDPDRDAIDEQASSVSANEGNHTLNQRTAATATGGIENHFARLAMRSDSCGDDGSGVQVKYDNFTVALRRDVGFIVAFEDYVIRILAAGDRGVRPVAGARRAIGGRLGSGGRCCQGGDDGGGQQGAANGRRHERTPHMDPIRTEPRKGFRRR